MARASPGGCQSPAGTCFGKEWGVRCSPFEPSQEQCEGCKSARSHQAVRYLRTVCRLLEDKRRNHLLVAEPVSRSLCSIQCKSSALWAYLILGSKLKCSQKERRKCSEELKQGWILRNTKNKSISSGLMQL